MTSAIPPISGLNSVDAQSDDEESDALADEFNEAIGQSTDLQNELSPADAKKAFDDAFFSQMMTQMREFDKQFIEEVKKQGDELQQ